MSKNKLITNFSTFQRHLNEVQNFNSSPMKRSITMGDIENLLEKIEMKLDAISFKKDRTGMIFKLNPHFKRRPMKEFKINSTCTTVEAIKISEGWRLFNAKREVLYSQEVRFLNPENYTAAFAEFFTKNNFI